MKDREGNETTTSDYVSSLRIYAERDLGGSHEIGPRGSWCFHSLDLICMSCWHDHPVHGGMKAHRVWSARPGVVYLAIPWPAQEPRMRPSMSVALPFRIEAAHLHHELRPLWDLYMLGPPVGVQKMLSREVHKLEVVFKYGHER